MARVLGTCTDGRAIVWSVDASGNASNNQHGYGPYTGYTAQRIACGPMASPGSHGSAQAAFSPFGTWH